MGRHLVLTPPGCATIPSQSDPGALGTFQMSDTEKTHQRRVRYRGTHPRTFSEKYKELQPEKYAQEVEKVLDRGQTPAGMHRPICVEEILTVLNPRPGETGLDATLGYGGHTGQMLRKMEHQGRLFALDADPVELPRTEQRLRALGYAPDHLILRRMNFAGIGKLKTEVPEGFDFILADLGISSMQLDNPARGFTFKEDGPLDLRLNPQRGLTAAAMLRTCPPDRLEQLLRENADEPRAREISAALFAAREDLSTTHRLAETVRSALTACRPPIPLDQVQKAITRTFQALRIAVNDEFGVLDLFLRLLPEALKSGGRVAILSFHSGEDRRVKKAFKEGLAQGCYSQIADTPQRPSPQEIHTNPRSRSAKLRWAIRA